MKISMHACVVFLMLLASISYGQGILVLKDGTEFRYSKMTLQGDIVSVKPTKGKRFKVQACLIEQQIIPASREVNYMKPCAKCSNSKTQPYRYQDRDIDLSTPKTMNHTFFSKNLEGMARIYLREEVTSSGGGSAMVGGSFVPTGGGVSKTKTFCYLELDTLFMEIFQLKTKKNALGISKLSVKKNTEEEKVERYNLIEKAFADDTIIQEEIANSNVVNDYHELKDLLEDFNLRIFKAEDYDYQRTGKITFLRTKENQFDLPLDITVNGVMSYKGLMPEEMITLEVSADHPSKICFSGSCKLITANSYYTKVFDITYQGEYQETKIAELDNLQVEYHLRHLILLAEQRERRAKKKKK